MGIKDGEFWKKSYNSIYLGNDYDNYHYLAIETDYPLPVCGCGSFHLDYDLDGKLLQDLMLTSEKIQHLTVNATSNSTRGLIVFGWIGDENGPARKFLESFEKVPENKKISTIIKIFFEYIENTFFEETWWELLTESQKKILNIL